MKKIISLCIILVILVMTSFVYATTTFVAKLECNKTTVKAGEELEIVLKLEDFTENENGINVILGTIEYDKNIFEKLDEDDIELLQYWVSPVYNAENGKIILEANEFVDTSHNVLKIKFNVKETMNDNMKTEIKVKDICASDGQTDIYVEDAVAVVHVQNHDSVYNLEDDTLNNKTLIAIFAILVIIIIGSICIVFVKKKI